MKKKPISLGILYEIRDSVKRWQIGPLPKPMRNPSDGASNVRVCRDAIDSFVDMLCHKCRYYQLKYQLLNSLTKTIIKYFLSNK